MRVSDLGEFPLIERLARLVQREAHPLPLPDHLSSPLLVGIGDDAAAWRADSVVQVFTTDTLVDGVHFRFAQASPWDVGWKGMAVNLSDVAAMGAVPQYALVTLGLPLDVPVTWVDDLYRGMLAASSHYGAQIVGGDIVRSPVLFLTVAMTGVTDLPLLLRSAARPGDAIAVTGPLGGSAGGLRLLEQPSALPAEVRAALHEAHYLPKPRVAEGRLLAQEGIRCAMDISDGLLGDLGKLCTASGVSALIFLPRVPIHPALRQAFPQEAESLALSGGEDYELLFTGPPALVERLLPRLPPGAGIIGTIVEGPPGKVRVVRASGEEVPWASGGWNHLRRP
ncbi:MAG: thiamine-phosphate kinase [Dehalococcoidia bacterium]|nr:thiamine-phosphate kinase [Dehalococcoidia bacterium]MDW8119758.1 thiamine-phosphate kinase [Chloroflexota bacterium]